VEEGETIGVLGGVVARDGDDAYVEEVDEELVGGDFLGGAGAPEEAAVEILADEGGLVDAEGFAEFAGGAPGVFVEGGVVDRGVGGVGGGCVFNCSWWVLMKVEG
jgi:hypothetical protein